MSVYRDLLHLDAPVGTRFEIGLDLLSEGQPIVYHGARLLLTNEELMVEVPSSRDMASVTERTARSDFDWAQAMLAELAEQSDRFRQLVDGRHTLMTLIHDYGTGSVTICNYEGDAIRWQQGFPRE